ncbi:hypothetical protein GRJ2_001881700 [Grus japonensis]|uniref:Uncharacterized protein n=1 Tax=Grus japonensis TaxID=30415 RepID=A0ABC9X9D3_GRUJA
MKLRKRKECVQLRGVQSSSAIGKRNEDPACPTGKVTKFTSWSLVMTTDVHRCSLEAVAEGEQRLQFLLPPGNVWCDEAGDCEKSIARLTICCYTTNTKSSNPLQI